MSLACSVIIPTYNAAHVIGDQLEALANQQGEIAFEVIVADNGSTDGLAAAVDRWSADLDIRIVDASARRGPSAARNLGAENSPAPLLLFCDADDRVNPTWVIELVGALNRHSFAGGPYRPFSSREGRWMPHYDDDRLPQVAWDSWPYAFGGNLGIRADVYRALGGFDESLTGAEEIEFAWRARQQGHEPVFVPGAWLDYRIRPGLRGRLWHEYNSGRGTTIVARRLVPERMTRRTRRSQVRHTAILVSRVPKSLKISDWEAWAAVLAYDAGIRAGWQDNQ